MAIVNITCVVVDGTAPTDGTLARQPTVQPITWPIGDAGTINFAVTGTDGVIYDLTDQTLAIAQVVYTVTQQPGVTGVAFAIGGKAIEVPTAAGAQVPGPVGRADYLPQAPVP